MAQGDQIQQPQTVRGPLVVGDHPQHDTPLPPGLNDPLALLQNKVGFILHTLKRHDKFKCMHVIILTVVQS